MADRVLVNLEKVSKSYGVKPLLDEVSTGVHEGDRIGVVGLNGGGKTTLLEVLTGLEQPDSGRVSRVNGLRQAAVTQRGDLPAGATVGEVILGPLGLAEHEWASNRRIRDVLGGIGFGADLGGAIVSGADPEGRRLSARVDELSGGERRRVALAAALVRDLDLLVLDEPTNHLDIEGVYWLAEHLYARGAALVVVTHDRWFLDTVATGTWEVVDGKVESYEGGYNDWIYARAERARRAEAAEERRRNLARKELAWLRRGAPARTSKPRYRVEAAEALIADVPSPRDTVELTAFARRRLGKVVIELEDVELHAPAPDGGQGRLLADDLTWRLAPGERVGLVGVNGSGKTTLLRTLGGEWPPAAGRRIEGRTVRIGWLRQELDDLPADMRVLAAVEDVARTVQLGKTELSASQLAERLGFSPARQRTPVRDLSGGERRRLQLTRVLMDEPNVLLLDEPTNDLDIDTLQQLEDLLDGWPGTLVVISHDRYMIERICDSIWALFGDGKLTNLPRGIDQYLQRRAELAAQGPRAGALGKHKGGAENRLAQVAGPAGVSGGGGAVEQAASDPAGGAGAAGPQPTAAEHRAMNKEMGRMERTVDKLESRIAELHAALAESATEPDRLAELDSELSEVTARRDAAEQRWMELAAEIG